MSKVIVIGGGISGLAVAALLGKQGFKVTLLEKNSQIGGLARIYKEKGFTFDMGPSWYLMPEVYEKFFSIFNHKSADFYRIKRLDPSYRVFFEDSKSIDISTKIQKNIKTFNRLEENGGEKLKKYLIEIEKYYAIALKDFIYQEPKHRSLFRFLRIFKIYQSFKYLVSQHFKNIYLQKLLLFPSLFLGNYPKNTPAFYSVLNYADLKQGVWYPENGMNSIVLALHKLCQKYKVKIKLNDPVKKLEIKNNQIKSVLTSKNKYQSDIVINSADLAYFETKLIPQNLQTYPKKYWNKKTIAPSGFLIYLGLNKKIKKLTHHNLYFVEDWDNNFSDIFQNRIWSENPSFYISCPSKTNINTAPKNCENLFIFVPIAIGLKNLDREKYTDKIIDKLEEITADKIRDSIIVKEIYDGENFMIDYNSYMGTSLGLSHTLFQSGPFRPAHKSKKIKNLYYCGQYTTPGVGVPMVLMSAVQTSDLIQNEWVI